MAVRTLLDILKAVALLCVCFLCIAGGFALLQVHASVAAIQSEVQTTAGAARKFIASADQLVQTADDRLKEVEKTQKELDGLLADSRRLLTDTKGPSVFGTIQNVNSVLLQVGLITDRAEEASRNQAEYWENLNREALRSVGLFNQTLEELQPTLKSLATTAESASRVVGDPNIPLMLKNMGKTSGSIASAADSVDQKVKQLLKPGNLIVSIFKTLLGLGGSAAQIVK